MVAIKKKGLGRGLEALLGEKTQQASPSTDINRLPLTALQAGKHWRLVADEPLHIPNLAVERRLLVLAPVRKSTLTS
jgi:hypothetical protein